MRFWFEKFRKGDMRDMEHQRQIIDTFVNSVYVFDDRVVLNFNFTDDSKTISREEVLGSSAVENAPPHPQTIRSGDFLWRTVQNENRNKIKAGYHYGSGILPFAIFNSVWYTRLSPVNWKLWR